MLNEVATCWMLIRLLLSNNSTFWKWRTMKCCHRSELRELVLCKKENGKIWTGGGYKKIIIIGALTKHPALSVELRQNVDLLIDRNFLRMDFTSAKERPQLETPVIIRLARRWTHEAQSPPKERPALMLRTQPTLHPAMLELSTIKSRDMKLKRRLGEVVQQVATSGNLLNGIEPSSIFVQQRSTAFNTMNGIFQLST